MAIVNLLKARTLTLIAFLLVYINPEVCGKARVKRIVGGKIVPTGEFPFAISLRNAKTGEHLCGGAAVKRDFIITAAHCIEDSLPSDYVVHFENAKSDNSVKGQNSKFGISKIHIHNLYEKRSNSHDIALLQLAKPMTEFKIHPEKILPTNSFGLTGECNVYGYGAIEMNSKQTFNSLRVGTVKIISYSDCLNLLGKYIAPKPDGGMICALGNSSDACQGDSGSPLVCNGILEGIVSYGMGCGINTLPGVYTRVASHMDWITDVMKKSKND